MHECEVPFFLPLADLIPEHYNDYVQPYPVYTHSDFSQPILSTCHNLYCNICDCFSCKHSPLLTECDGMVKAQFSPSVIASSFCSKSGTLSSRKVLFNALSYNCMCLSDDSDASEWPAASENRALLLEFINVHKYNIVCLQETRTLAGKTVCGDFVCVSSGRTPGRADTGISSGLKAPMHGCETWIPIGFPFRVTLPSGKCVDFFVESDQICVVFSDPRILIVSIMLQDIPFYIANLYAPHQTHGSNTCILWWNETSKIISKHVPDVSKLLLLGDFNTKLGAALSYAVGDCAPDKENRIGKNVHSILLKLKLSVPATFSQYCTASEHHTFVHHTGSLHRIDFIAMPMDQLSNSPVASTIDVQAQHLGDHRGQQLQSHFTISSSYRSNTATYDFNKFDDPVAHQNFLCEIHKGSFFAPFLDNSSRLHYFNSFVQHALVKWFPLDKCSVRNIHTSEHTRSCVRFRDACRVNVKDAKHRMAPNFVIQHHAMQFKAAAHTTKVSAQIDFNTRLQQLCTDADKAHSSGNLKQFYAIRNQICPRKRSQHLVSIHRGDEIITNFLDIKRAFLEHFSLALSGLTVDPIEAVSEYLVPDLAVLLVELTGIDDIASSSKSSNLTSAAGLDTFKYIIYKKFPYLLDALQPVFHFASCNSPPFQWFVSILQELFKGKGNVHHMKSYRDILLANTSGKHFSKNLRSIITPYLNTYILDSMCGGFLKRGTDFCSHFLRALSSIARNSHCSCCVFFADLKSAFATVIRAFVIPEQCSDEFVVHAFKALKFDETMFEEFKAVISLPCAVIDAGVPSECVKLLSKLASNTYFVMKGLPDLIKYTNGTGAGTPLADLLFTFMMARILRNVQSKLSVACLSHVPSFPVVKSSPFFPETFEPTVTMGASYVDDTFFSAIHKVAATCVKMAAKTAAIVVDEFALHSLTVNFEAGKSEFTIDLVGPDSASLKNDIYCLDVPHIVISSQAFGPVKVHVPIQYPHMGSVHNPGRSALPEMKRRTSSAVSASKENGRIFRNKSCNTKSKLLLTSSLSLSRLRYNICSIHQWHSAVITMFDKTYFRVYRAALLRRNSAGEVDTMSNHDMCTKFFIPSPHAYRVKIRLKYLLRVCMYAPVSLKALIWQDFCLSKTSSWLSLCFKDLLWLRTCSFLLSEADFPDPFVDAKAWFDLMVHQTKFFLTQLDNAVNASCFDVTVAIKPPKLCNVQCAICGARFPSLNELGPHMFRRHQIKSLLRNKIITTHCLHCLKEFSTRTRIHDHIAYRSKVCQRYYLSCVSDCDPDLVASLESTEAARVKELRASGRKVLFHPVRAFILPGPRPVPLPPLEDNDL